jgi:hypothetical protein
MCEVYLSGDDSLGLAHFGTGKRHTARVAPSQLGTSLESIRACRGHGNRCSHEREN